MQGLQGTLDLLTKAKDTRLNIAILIVSSGALIAGSRDAVTLNEIIKTTLQGLCFITLVRLTYSLIGVTYDHLNNKRETSKAKKEEQKQKEQKEADQEALKSETRNHFYDLDISELYIIQELKKQNHVRVTKSAQLFSLKNKKIVCTVATSDRTESVTLTKTAKKLLDKGLWNEFDNLKHRSLLRFFIGAQSIELTHFKEFENEKTITTRFRTGIGQRQPSYAFTNSQKKFSTYSESVIFCQPQNGYTYTIDPIAKKALLEALTPNEKRV
ncbi:MAG: hypothetical protein U9Q35_09775 [Pseudomonadota bacterium]|nr:hypothetical protein [Pseudomonadota bacterium]